MSSLELSLAAGSPVAAMLASPIATPATPSAGAAGSYSPPVPSLPVLTTHASVAAAAAAAVSAAAAAASASPADPSLASLSALMSSPSPAAASADNSKAQTAAAAAAAVATAAATASATTAALGTGALTTTSLTTPFLSTPLGSLPPLPLPLSLSAMSASTASLTGAGAVGSFSPFMTPGGVGAMGYPMSPYPPFPTGGATGGAVPRPAGVMPLGAAGFDASYSNAMMSKKFRKKINLACHFCDHAARRPGRQKMAMLVTCSSPHCRKVFCSRPSCYKKLPIGLRINTWEGFVEWKRQLEMGLSLFICPHCQNEAQCPGPQCQKRWQKRVHRGPPLPGEPGGPPLNMLMPPPYNSPHGLLGLASLSSLPGTTAPGVNTNAAAADANSVLMLNSLTSLVNSGAATSSPAVTATTVGGTTTMAAPTLTALNSASKASSPMTSTSANALNAVAVASAAAAAAAAVAKANGTAASPTAPSSLLHGYGGMDAYTAAGISAAAAAGSPPPGLASLSAFAPAVLTRGSSLGSLGPYHPPPDRVYASTTKPGTSAGANLTFGTTPYAAAGATTTPQSAYSFTSATQSNATSSPSATSPLGGYSPGTPLSSLSAAAHTAHPSNTRYQSQQASLQHQQYLAMVNQAGATQAAQTIAPATTAPAASPKSKA